jgi:hypothetical protein
MECKKKKNIIVRNLNSKINALLAVAHSVYNSLKEGKGWKASDLAY